jgi:hypothetical protein
MVSQDQGRQVGIERGALDNDSEATEGTVQCTCVYWERSGGLHISLIFGDGEGEWGVGVRGGGGGSLTNE